MTTNRTMTSLAIAGAIFISSTAALAQGFVSGSNGTDGALTFAAAAGTVVFDPVARGIDTDGDNVFHFTTIDIPAGTTVLLRADQPGLAEGRPVVWLATGAVNIAGAIDLSGAQGHAWSTLPRPSIPGAGGFGGGPGGTPSDNNPRGGAGPGGGGSGVALNGGFAGHFSPGNAAAGPAVPGGV
jgi:hypothetical protein